MRYKLTLPGMLAMVLLIVLMAGCGQSERQEFAEDMEPEETAMPEDAITSHNRLEVGPFVAPLPGGWTPEQPSSAMRKAQYRLAPVEGDPDEAEVTVFYFGPDAGTVEMNIERWMGQFTTADGDAVTEEEVTREETTVNGMPVTIVMFKGTQRGGTMGGPAEEKQGWMNISAIVKTPEGPWFFKGTGPEATMEKHLDGFKQMLNELEFTETAAHG